MRVADSLENPAGPSLPRASPDVRPVRPLVVPLTLDLMRFPLQVAIIAGNFELAEYIKNHKETDIGEWARRVP